VYDAFGNVDEGPRRCFEGALAQPKAECSLDDLVVLVLERVDVQRCPTAVRSKASLDHPSAPPVSSPAALTS
jgi:hypothetical protein